MAQLQPQIGSVDVFTSSDVDNGQTYIPFGKDGTRVFTNRFGDILNISTVDNQGIMAFDASSIAPSSRCTARERQQYLQDAARNCRRPVGLTIDVETESCSEWQILWANDRWPRFNYTVKGIQVTVQFIIRKGVVYQEFSITNQLNENQSLKLVLVIEPSEAKLMDLDSRDVTSKHPGGCDVTYESNGEIATIHEAGNGSVTARVTVFHQGNPINLQASPSEISMGNDHAAIFPANSTRVFTVAYKLQSSDSTAPTCPENINIASALEEDRLGIRLVKNNRFDPVFWRYLEHILCVCVVTRDQDDKHYSVLINGDLFYPLFTPMASFHMFRFLLLMYRVLETTGLVTSYLRADLRRRIKIVCERHIRWSFLPETFGTLDGWPYNVQNVESESVNEVPETEGPNSTFFTQSLQILKLFEFFQVFPEQKDLVFECLLKCAKVWIDKLQVERHETSRLWYRQYSLSYIAWEGNQNRDSEFLPLPIYHLGDLIYIWKAMKYVQSLCEENKDKFGEVLEEISQSELSHHELRTTILQRFICSVYPPGEVYPTHSVSRASTVLSESQSTSKDALAVSRSSEADRFLLYSHDTMLCEGVNWGFFTDDIGLHIDSAWTGMAELQGIDTEETWESPLRYALAIAMEKCDDKIQLDKEMPPEDLVELAKNKLLKCCLHSGLWSEQIDFVSKIPKWTEGQTWDPRTTYEIPTILLMIRLNYFVSREQAKTNQENVRENSPVIKNVRERRLANRKKILLEKMKKTTSTTVDKTKIWNPIDRIERSWLYPRPSFVGPKTGYSEEDTPLEIDLISQLYDGAPFDLFKDGVEIWRRRNMFTWVETYSFVVQIAKGERRNPSRWYFDSDDLDRDSRQVRTAVNAKKRFHYLSPLWAEHALVLYLATPKDDRHNMAHFLDRHRSFSSHFDEYLSEIANLWTTELHLSFIQLAEVGSSQGDGPEYSREPVTMVKEAEDEVRKKLCKGRLFRFFLQRDKQSSYFFEASEASLGYRIIGDMDDCLWTTVFVAHLPQGSSPWLKMPTDPADRMKWFDPNARHDQRKVLEPHLVEKMAEQIYIATEELLDEIDTWLQVKPQRAKEERENAADFGYNTTKGNFDELYRRSKSCLEVDRFLDIVQRQSKSNFNVLSQWLEREETRVFKPRWSEKDERKHGAIVGHHVRQVGRRIGHLKSQCERIEASISEVKGLREVILSNLNLAEAKTATRSAENVRIFTYATVIFLPLSFVSSVFSMQGEPPGVVLVSFVQVTTVALVLTLFFVFNAQSLASNLRSLGSRVDKSAHSRMEDTVNRWPRQWQHTLSSVAKADEEDILYADEPPVETRSGWLYLWFWLLCGVIEFPAARIVLGRRALYTMLYDRTVFREHMLLSAMQIVIAFAFVPLFTITWIALAFWSFISTLYGSIRSQLAKLAPFWKLNVPINDLILMEAPKSKLMGTDHSVSGPKEDVTQSDDRKQKMSKKGGEAKEREKKEERDRAEKEKAEKKRRKRRARFDEEVSSLIESPEFLTWGEGKLKKEADYRRRERMPKEESSDDGDGGNEENSGDETPRQYFRGKILHLFRRTRDPTKTDAEQ